MRAISTRLRWGAGALGLGVGVAGGAFLLSHPRQVASPPPGSRYIAEGFGGFAPARRSEPLSPPASKAAEKGAPHAAPSAPIASVPDPVQPALEAMAAKRYPEALKAARATLASVKRSSPSSLERHARLRARKIEGFALARQGDLKGAKASFATLAVEGAKLAEGTNRPAAPAGQPERPALVEDALYQKAICTAALGDKTGAEAQFRELMRAYPESPLMLAAMKRVARMHEGNIPKETEALWKRAMAIRGEKNRAERRALAMCGPLCLKELLKRAGQGEVPTETLAREMKTDETGTSLLALRDAARRHGFPGAQGVQLTQAGLKRQKLPVAALVAPGHFVLVESVSEKDGVVTLWDPQGGAKPARAVSGAEWPRLWGGGMERGASVATGYALALTGSEVKTASK